MIPSRELKAHVKVDNRVLASREVREDPRVVDFLRHDAETEVLPQRVQVDACIGVTDSALRRAIRNVVQDALENLAATAIESPLQLSEPLPIRR
jgi:hypothetical protein